MDDALLIYILFLIGFGLGYLRGYISKQEREWLNGYREGLKDAGFDITTIIEKFSKK